MRSSRSRGVRANGRRTAGVSAELGPGPLAAAQDVRQLDTGLVHEGREIEVPVGTQLRGHRLPAVGDLSAQVLEDHRLGLSIHDDLATGRQEREPAFDPAFDAAASLACQRAQLVVEDKLLALVSDEVEDGKHGLVGRAPQSARVSPRVPQPHHLHRQIPARVRWVQTATTPWSVKSPKNSAAAAEVYGPGRPLPASYGPQGRWLCQKDQRVRAEEMRSPVRLSISDSVHCDSASHPALIARGATFFPGFVG